MDCNQVDDQLIPYILGALESAERERLRAHVESCTDCCRQMQDEGETIARLAFAVPQLEAPAGLKERLFAKIAAADRPAVGKSYSRKWSFLDKRGLSLRTAGAVASVVLLGIVVGGVWFNGGLKDVADENGEIAGQLEQVVRSNQAQSDKVTRLADVDSDVMDVVAGRRPIRYGAPRQSAAAGASMNMLWGTIWEANARGMLMVSRSGSRALLLALDLQPLPSDKVYQVWLVKDGRRYNGGYFTVDSSGYGQTLIFPYPSIAEFDAIGITIEPVGGSSGPTGTRVLRGDL